MSTFLQLCQRYHLELGIGPGSVGTSPTTVLSQTGDLAACVEWIKRANIDIESMQKHWAWMQRTGTFNTVAGTAEYTIPVTSQTALSATLTRSGTTATATTAAHGYLPGQNVVIAGATQTEYNGTFTILAVPSATTFTYTVSGSPATPATGTITATLVDFDEVTPWHAAGGPYIKCYTTATGVSDEQPVWFIPSQEFEGLYDRGNFLVSQSRPAWYTIKRNGKIALYPEPNAVYTVTVPYRRIVQTLAADADVPGMPLKFHDAILYYALMSYGGATTDGGSTYKHAAARFDALYNRLCAEQLPDFTMFGAV